MACGLRRCPSASSNRYVARLLAVTEHDEAVAGTFVRVTGMLAADHLLGPTAMHVLAGSVLR
ncbi:MAG TPA: hypothetical protein VGO80_13960 [Solirubrobacteraceae bacterium]|nr:hypothetical protein [Solirubrobacteraceae bacterium]